MVNCKKRKNMTGTVDNAVEEIKNFFHTLQTSENWFRFGVTFSTQEKYYFLDTGTGKIFRVNQQVYRVLHSQDKQLRKFVLLGNDRGRTIAGFERNRKGRKRGAHIAGTPGDRDGLL